MLIAGAGGGYDVLGAIPLCTELTRLNKRFQLASLSFTNLRQLAGANRHADHPNLYEVPPAAATSEAYCPEAWLADWLSNETGNAHSVWAFEKTGVQPLVGAYSFLVERFDVDTVVLLDGGVDLVLRGDETSIGTPAEDLCSLAAVAELDVPSKIATCIGFGAELREGVKHAQVLARFAELTASQAFLGASAVTKQSEAGQQYLSALEHLFSNQVGLRTSHIHTVVRKAMLGEFGPIAEHVWLSPLMPMYWHFSLDEVAGSHRFLEHLLKTHEIGELTLMIEACRKDVGIRPPEAIPI